VAIFSSEELNRDHKDFAQEAKYAVKEKETGTAQSKEQKTEEIGR
jgi:hypothetical protein